MNKFNIGQRVRRSAFGLENTRGGEKRGVVTGFAKTGHRPKMYVLVDGRKHANAFMQCQWERE